MKYSVIALAFCLLIACNTEKPAEKPVSFDTEIQKLIDQVAGKYVPDKRIEVFSVGIEEDSAGIIIWGTTTKPDAKADFEKLVAAKFPDIRTEIINLPDPQLKDKIYGIVNVSVCNIRSSPGHAQELGTQSLLGQAVKVLEPSIGWNFFRIQTSDHYISWVDQSGIELVNETEVKNWLEAEKVMFTEQYGFSYNEPDISSGYVSDLVVGNLLKYISQDQNFYKVQYPDNRIAYIEKGKCQPYKQWLDERNPTQENLVKTAKKFMGLPYLWGGTSSKSVDCSGFTKSVYFLNGILLDRDASQQTHTGELIDTKNGFGKLQPGDLLFFGSKAENDEPEKVTHVAMYIGDTEYIHASGMVRINSLDSKRPNYNQHRYNTFIRARRVITSIDTNGIVSLAKVKFPL